MSRRRKISIVAGIVFVVAILIPVIRHYQLRFAVANYIAELKAKGEPMDLAQVIPPPVLPEQNGAPLITNAIYHLKENSIPATNYLFAMRIITPGRAMIGWQQPDIRGDATNTWQELGDELAEANNNLIQLRNLNDHPFLDFNLNYSQGWSMPIPHLSKLKRTAQWLDASALYNLHQRKPTAACADVHAMLAIVKGETEERTTISQLVRIAIASIGANATWEILQATNVSEEDLAQLQQDWQSPEFIRAYEHILLWERVAAMLTFDQTRRIPYFKIMFAHPPSRWNETQWRWFWSYKDEVLGLQAFQVVIDAARMAETNNSFQPVQSFVHKNFVRLNLEKENGETQMTNDLNLNDEAHVMFISSAYASFSAIRKTIKIETTRNVVVAAIALKRYALRHHQLPEKLDELTPDLLQTVPIDCMDGEPLRYQPNADGTFLLYSVGANGVDDGGNPSLEKGVTSSNFYWQNDHALDWVWPQPATEAEIQAYYKKLSSQKN